MRATTCWCIFFCAIQAYAAVNTGLIHSTFERTGRGGEPAFLWRGGQAEASFHSAGVATLAPRRATGPAIRLRFLGARQASRPEAEAPDPIQVRYFNESHPGGEVRPQFHRVRYRNLYPGIDLIYHIEGGLLEYDLELGPGANPDLIRLDYGTAAVRLDASGEAVIGRSLFTIRQKPPEVRQRSARISCKYALQAGGSIALHLAAYDRTQPLTIDPVITFATTLGGEGFDAAYAMAVDASGAIYVAGETDSASFTNGGRRWSRDAFAAKLDSSGSNVLYVTYFGGSGPDAAHAIAIDSWGNAYLAGTSSSQDFPVTPGAFSRSVGADDAFVVKLDPTGAIAYSTMLGSVASDQATGIAIDTSGNAYVTGQTNGSFPTTSGALQRTSKGGFDCFVSKLSPDGGTLLYSTVLGGAANDFCRGIAVDSAGAAYVTGVTYSVDFPTPGKPPQADLRGIADAFVAKIDPAGATLAYSSFLGGDSFDEANAIAVDSSGCAYIAGNTTSWNFPTSSSSVQPWSNGGYDAFVAKFSADGGAVLYATLVGGRGTDTAMSIAVDDTGRAVIGGFTNSTDLPVRQSAQPTLGGSFDAFAAVLDGSGSSLLFCTYLGGAGDDRAFAVAAGPQNSIYLAGYTQSADFPQAPPGLLTSGNSDVFVAQLTYSAPTPSGSVFIPVTACRFVDTRPTSSLGSMFGPPYMKAGSSRDFPVSISNCRIPASAQAYSLNVAVVPHGFLNWLTIWPAGQPMPLASTLNSWDGRMVANAAIVPAGPVSAGTGVSVFASDDTDVIIDVTGYFDNPATSPGLVFYPWNPCRIADTRGYGPFTPSFGPPYMAAGSTRTFPVPQSPCAPPAAAQAYSLNVTAVPRRGTLQSLTVWPAGQTKPPVITIASLNGQIVADAAIVAAGTGGGVDIYSSDETNVFFDINGYFAPAGGPGALSFTPVKPCRLADSRASTQIGTGVSPSRTLDVFGSKCNIPQSARAYSLNVTVVPSGPLGWLTVWPTGQPQPMASTLNAYNGAIVANAAIVPAGVNGKIEVFASDPTDVIVDINGYFAP